MCDIVKFNLLASLLKKNSMVLQKFLGKKYLELKFKYLKSPVFVGHQSWILDMLFSVPSDLM